MTHERREAAPDSSLPRRRDAQRNRDAILDAAQTAFAGYGVDASLEQIARDAGLAIGTLYRHYPSRLDLLLAAFEPRLCEFLAEASAALRMPDPWDGFCFYMESLFEMQAGDRGFNDFISQRFPADQRTEPMHDRMCELIKDVLERAQTSGQVRADVTEADIISLIWANGSILDATRLVAPQAWRRNLHLMLDSFRSPTPHDLPALPLSSDQLYEAMVQRNSSVAR